MSRETTVAFDSAIASGHLTFILLIDLAYDSGTQYLAYAPFNITWNGNEYIGISKVGTIEPLHETSEIEATGLSGTLVGDPSRISDALNEDIQGRLVTLRLAALNASHQIIADPVICFRGRLDTMNVELGKTATVKVTAESRFADWDTPRIRRWNSPDQRLLHPTDTFYDTVPQMVSKELPWGVPGGGVAGGAAVNNTSSGNDNDSGWNGGGD